MKSVMKSEATQAARSFRQLGSALEGFGRRLITGGKHAVDIGRRLGRITPAQLEQLEDEQMRAQRRPDEQMLALRRPLDELRALVEDLAAVGSGLRAVVDALADVVGVNKDN